MSKKSELTPEMMESIMCRIADKLTEVFKTFVEQLVSSITDRIDTKLADFHMSLNIMTTRMDALESEVNRFNFPPVVTQPAILDLPASSSLLASSSSTNATQQASTNHNQFYCRSYDGRRA